MHLNGCLSPADDLVKLVGVALELPLRLRWQIRQFSLDGLITYKFYN